VGPTTPHGARSVTTQYGNFEYPFNLPYLAAAGGASFVARWSVLHARRLEWTLRQAMCHPGFSFVEIIAPCSTAYGRWNPEGRGLDPKKLRRRGLELMKHYQKVGRIRHGIHPKDATISVDDGGSITEIVEGIFIDEPKPDLQAAIDQMAVGAEKRWQALRETMDRRPPPGPRVGRLARSEIQLGGFGGQGIVSAGKIIGQAAALFDQLEACFTQSYGPEARGGAAGAQVVVSSEPIHHPHLIAPDSAIILSQEAYAKYVPRLANGALLLIDEGLVQTGADHRRDLIIRGLAATRIAGELGNIRTANSVLIGLWAALMGIISREALLHSLAASVPPKTVDVNRRAFEIGYQEGARLKQEAPGGAEKPGEGA
jgi:2-oxoglutarate ferredoxin oxidoreductase subunit gamma